MTKRHIFLFTFLLLSTISQGAERDPLSPSSATQSGSFPAGFAQPQEQAEGWVALPPGRPFPPLPSDPRDLKLALRKNSKDELEADVGNYRSFAGWRGEMAGKDTLLHLGIEGNAYFVLGHEGSKFPLFTSDGVIGLYAEAARGSWLYQFRITHLSAHLADGLYGLRQRFTYTRETLSLRLARQLGFVRAYGGYHFLAHTKPDLPRHSLQLGAYSIFPWHWKSAHPYLGADLKIRNAQEGTTYQLSAGAAFVSSLNAPPIRISANYLKGHDLRGQYYYEKTEKFSVGLDMDL